MKTATVLLLLTTLILAPFPIRIDAALCLLEKKAQIFAKLWGINLLYEEAAVWGPNLKINGTINTEIDLLDVKVKDGLSFSKCLTLRAVYVAVKGNPGEAGSVKLVNAANALCSICVPIIQQNTHVRVGVKCMLTNEKSSVNLQIFLTTSLLESIFALIKQTLKKMKAV